MEVGFTELEYQAVENDGVVGVCIELLSPVDLRTPILMRVETEDSTAQGKSIHAYNIKFNSDCIDTL